MNHKGTVRLETERLILRAFTIDDAPDMFNNWASNENVAKFLTWRRHGSVEVTKSIISEWVNEYEDLKNYQWAIVIKDSNTLIGSISAVHIKEDVGACEIGYCIGENWWHQGYTSEAFKKVIEFLFNEVGAKRIWACHAVDNPNSGKVMQKCGLKKEGLLRKACATGSGKIYDMAIYAILSEDYYND